MEIWKNFENVRLHQVNNLFRDSAGNSSFWFGSVQRHYEGNNGFKAALRQRGELTASYMPMRRRRCIGLSPPYLAQIPYSRSISGIVWSFQLRRDSSRPTDEHALRGIVTPHDFFSLSMASVGLAALLIGPFPTENRFVAQPISEMASLARRSCCRTRKRLGLPILFLGYFSRLASARFRDGGWRRSGQSVLPDRG